MPRNHDRYPWQDNASQTKLFKLTFLLNDGRVMVTEIVEGVKPLIVLALCFNTLKT